MISINQWFTKNTKIPIIAASSLLAVIWVCASIGLVQLNTKHRSEVLENLTNTLSLALSQNNRILIESLLDTTMVQLGANDALICRNGKVIVGVNSSYLDCTKNISENRVIPGFSDYYLTVTYPPIWKSLSLWVVMILGCLFVLFTVLILRRMQTRFSEEILEPFKVGLLERGPMQIQEFDIIRLQLKEAQEIKTQQEIAVAMNTLASQVSHDIRSPISALNSVIGQLTQVPENHRLIIRNSVNRINDIANQLLTKGKQISNSSSVKQNAGNIDEFLLEVELLSPIVDSLISEKRIQFREKQNIVIDAEINKGYGLFAKINGTEFKRVLSNLTNNAIEALPNGTGKFSISIKGEGDSVIVSAQDNGKGIPEHILKKLGEIGVTHGKEGMDSGSGLGVYHAKKTIETFGGSFEIISKESAGTTIVMKFPKSPAPKWFVEKLVLQNGMQVISLDDDLSIHQVWNGRFQSKEIASISTEHLTFTSGEEFKAWFKKSSDNSAIRLYLMDYELLNQKQTGLEIIEELGIGPQSILVTSRYEEAHIRGRCERFGVRLIPKAMAGFVPIQIEKPKTLYHEILIDDARKIVNKPNITKDITPIIYNRIRYDLCLLDDDKSLIQTLWDMVAKTKGHSIKMFSTPEEFQAAADSIDRETPIFIDVSLGNGVSGIDFAKEVHKMGFNNISLATGYSADSIKAPAFVRRIIGKDYPDDI